MFFLHCPACPCNSKNKSIFLISIATPISEMELFSSFFFAADFTQKAAFETNS